MKLIHYIIILFILPIISLSQPSNQCYSTFFSDRFIKEDSCNITLPDKNFKIYTFIDKDNNGNYDPCRYIVIKSDSLYFCNPNSKLPVGDYFIDNITQTKNGFNIEIEGSNSQDCNFIFSFKFDQANFYLYNIHSVITNKRTLNTKSYDTKIKTKITFNQFNFEEAIALATR